MGRTTTPLSLRNLPAALVENAARSERRLRDESEFQAIQRGRLAPPAGGAGMTAEKASQDKLLEKLRAIRTLAEESEELVGTAAPDVEKLLAILEAQAGLQQVLLEKLLEVMEPTELDRDLNDTFQQAVQDLLNYFGERVRLAGKVADAAALRHLRKE